MKHLLLNTRIELLLVYTKGKPVFRWTCIAAVFCCAIIFCGGDIMRVKVNHGPHTICDVKYHFVWMTRYRYPILKGRIAQKCRELLVQGCSAMGLQIIEGQVCPDHVRMLISAPTTIAPAEIMKVLKGKYSKFMQDEFPELKKRYWGQSMWERGYLCSTEGTVSEERIWKYIENQMDQDSSDNFRILDSAST